LYLTPLTGKVVIEFSLFARTTVVMYIHSVVFDRNSIVEILWGKKMTELIQEFVCAMNLLYDFLWMPVTKTVLYFSIQVSVQLIIWIKIWFIFSVPISLHVFVNFFLRPLSSISCTVIRKNCPTSACWM
jgi:hypothetical protein